MQIAITKLELFAAYLPYKVVVSDELSGTDFWWYLTVVNVKRNRDGDRLHLRPLSALQTPILHPVTGEWIESPAEWIAKQIVKPPSAWHILFFYDDIINYLHNEDGYYARYSRQIDRLALQLHFDLYIRKY